MESADGLLGALPIRGVRVRAGSYGNCGGVIFAMVDLEPGTAKGLEVVGTGVDAPDWADDFPEDIELCVDSIEEGAEAKFSDLFGAEPAVRLVVRRLRFNPVDAIEFVGRKAGELIVTEAIGMATPVRHSRPARQRLRVAVGSTAEGAPVELDLKENAHGGMGPHGMLIGAPGSGKTEALHTVLTGLTDTHSPEELNLLLLDFASGAGFGAYQRMPHTREAFSDIKGQSFAMHRIEPAINTELHLREQLLRDTGNFATRTEYEQARENGRPLKPLPNLLIVIDEFSDLLGATPDFMTLLIRIGRLGRPLGVHLLLAAQHLAHGRLRGLDGFLSYRIGMRTGSAAESRAAIGVSDAFELPGTGGHAYLKAGTEQLTRFRFGS